MNEVFSSKILKPSLVLFTKCCTFGFFILSILISSSVVFAATIFVPGDYDTIQDAINASYTGDTIKVAAGTYYENITMKSGVVIQGAGQDISIINGGGSVSVVTANGVDSTAKLDGFTVTNGYNFYDGGGMYNYNSSPTVTNCTFSSNTGMNKGGGMYNYNSSPTVINCTFSGNSAGSGGGMYNDFFSSPTVEKCTFSGNTDFYGGGGMYNTNSSPNITNCTFSENTHGGMWNYYSSPTVINCIFSGNSAGGWSGGGMHNESSSLIITNCIFSENTSEMGGGGIYNVNSSLIITNSTFFENTTGTGDGGGIYNSNSLSTITNCTFFKNTAWMYGHGGGIYDTNGSLSTVTNCILWEDTPDEISNYMGGTTSVTYSNIEGSYAGTGNINVDPKFVDAAQGDLHLQKDSPCIDAGNNSAPHLPGTDIDGDNRKIDHPNIVDTGSGTPPIVDMGVDEFKMSSENFFVIPNQSGGAAVICL